MAVPADLAQSSTIVQAPAMWENNLTGAGKTIAILDTGVDRFHTFLGGRVVEEACYSSSSNCPNGQKTQTGTDSGAPCTYASDGCQHGTHVAGIAAGQGSDFSGVAPNANIMSVQVFSRQKGSVCDGTGEDPCTLTFVSDQIAGLERVYQLRNARSFVAVNMSFGNGRFTSRCDTDSRKSIIDNLRTAGIATVIASGNDGFTDAVSAPACISSAITVGNTTKQDALAAGSNMDRGVDLLAPGSGVNSSVPGGWFASFSGTSMAAPHVAGAWALLEERDPFKDVTSNLLDLQAKGTLVMDTRAGGTAGGYRINIADAARVRLANDNFGSPKALSGATTSINGINVAATRESGEPDHMPLSKSLGENSVWYSWTAPISGPVTLDTCTSGFNTALAAYTGSDIGSLSHVADNDDTCNVPNHRGSKIAFDAVAGRDYRIAVAGVEGGLAASEGTFTLNVGYAPSSNDAFSDARALSGNSATVNGTTLAATREFGEPDHYTTNPPDSDFWIGEHSVWYSWTAPFSGPMEINTRTAKLDSILAVYTGGDLGTLNRVADNRYTGTGGVRSKVEFNATASTTYRIAVADAGGDYTQDTFTLEVVDKRPPTVTGTRPADNATGLARGANVKATFSEPMRASTITGSTFMLIKQGATSNVSAAVTYDAATKTATLKPNNNLTAGATYTATMTTQAKDLAGNGLDQDPNTAGNQAKTWKFKVQP